MLDDLKQAYHLDKQSTVNLQRANDYLKIEEVFLSSEVSNTLLKLCDKLKTFREDLLKKQKQIEETILFYFNEGLSLSGKDFIYEETAAEELKAFSGDDEDILTPQFIECECKEQFLVFESSLYCIKTKLRRAILIGKTKKESV